MKLRPGTTSDRRSADSPAPFFRAAALPKPVSPSTAAAENIRGNKRDGPAWA